MFSLHGFIGVGELPQHSFLSFLVRVGCILSLTQALPSSADLEFSTNQKMDFVSSPGSQVIWAQETGSDTSFKRHSLDWRCSSVMKHILSLHEDLGLLPSINTYLNI